MLLTSCSKDDIKYTEVDAVSFSNPPQQIEAGGSFKLSVKTDPADADEPYTLVFESSDPAVASVDQDGMVKALKKGKAILSVHLKEKTHIRTEYTLDVSQQFFAPINKKFRKVAYYPAYRDLDAIPDDYLKMLDVVCYSFATINKDYTLSVDNPKKLPPFVSRCKALGVKVLISFGGGGSGKANGPYTKMAASAEHRATFIASLKKIVETYDLDGVDSDWEYPRTTDGSDKGNTALMKELSNWLHDPEVDKLLTMAITSGKYTGAVASAIETECFEYADWFNIMCYDTYLGWADVQPKPDPLEWLNIGYNYWVGTRGMPAYKFVGGTSIYGRPSDEANNGTPVSYAEIMRQGGDPDGFSANVSTAKYTGTVYYNGRPFMREKARFCLDKQVGGIMFWEGGQDTTDEKSIIRAACDEIAGR